MQNTPLKETKIQYNQTTNVSLPRESDLVHARGEIVESLSPTPVFVDEIIRECQISASVVQTVLLELELAGLLERHPGNRVSLIV